jgi:hypothetical protein
MRAWMMMNDCMVVQISTLQKQCRVDQIIAQVSHHEKWNWAGEQNHFSTSGMRNRAAECGHFEWFALSQCLSVSCQLILTVVLRRH